MTNRKNKYMRDTWEVTKSTLAGVLSGVLLSIGSYFFGDSQGYSKAQETYIKQVASAPEEYVKELDKIISSANKANATDIIANARAIVSARDDLRDSLTTISSSLNSELDRLAMEVKSAEEKAVKNPGLSTDDIQRTFEVLKIKWPSKKKQIEFEVRKLIAELGLEKIQDR